MSETETKVIREFTAEYRFLSNFWSCYIWYIDEWYPSVENAYQAAKMKYPHDRKAFVNIKASEAKKLGRVLPMQSNWDALRLGVMYRLVMEKFKTHEDLRKRLAATGDAELQEGNWWGDRFWGTVNGEGENQLGKILMRVREELR